MISYVFLFVLRNDGRLLRSSRWAKLSLRNKRFLSTTKASIMLTPRVPQVPLSTGLLVPQTTTMSAYQISLNLNKPGSQDRGRKSVCIPFHLLLLLHLRYHSSPPPPHRPQQRRITRCLSHTHIHRTSILVIMVMLSFLPLPLGCSCMYPTIPLPIADTLYTARLVPRSLPPSLPSLPSPSFS